jgi:tetratricopeptide (TPR) repeat protein
MSNAHSHYTTEQLFFWTASNDISKWDIVLGAKVRHKYGIGVIEKVRPDQNNLSIFEVLFDSYGKKSISASVMENGLMEFCDRPSIDVHIDFVRINDSISYENWIFRKYTLHKYSEPRIIEVVKRIDLKSYDTSQMDSCQDDHDLIEFIMNLPEYQDELFLRNSGLHHVLAIKYEESCNEPKDYYYLVKAALCWRDCNEIKKSTQMLNNAISLLSISGVSAGKKIRDSSSIQNMLAKNYNLIGNTNVALEHALSALKINETHYVHNNLGAIYKNLRKYDESHFHFEKAKLLEHEQ